jgi:hypothetical protein
MSGREKARRTEQSRRSYTIDEWCLNRRISRAMFYKMAAQGLGPKTHYAGSKPLISDEADAAWVRAREAEAETTAA